MRSNITHNRPSDTADNAAPAHELPSALLASVTHDLRNPLSVILGASEVLHDEFPDLPDEDRRAYLRTIRRECVRMDEYVHGLFHVTRLLFAGNARLARDWIGIDELVGSAVERLLRYRDEARVSVHVASPLPPVHVHGALVEQALLNVLDNAVKFSPPGATVTVRLATNEEGSTIVEIADTGPGIPASQRERVFAMFVSDETHAHGRAGYGVGLAISRSILRAHGGDVVAEAPADGETGARVRLTLPAQEVIGWSAP